METIYALWRGVGVLCETLLLTYLLWKKLPPAHNRRSRLILCVAGMLSLCVSNTTNGLVSESALHGGLGLPRIRSIVAVHKGIFNLRRENGLFTVEILLPVLEEEA